MSTPDYWSHARRFIPRAIRVLIIAESPPAPRAGKFRYFYFEQDKPTEVLFSNVMQAVLGYECSEIHAHPTKEDLLRQLQMEGVFLLDAVETPINKMDNLRKDILISSNYSNLKDRMKFLRNMRRLGNQTRIVVLKQNVGEILSKLLPQDGYMNLATCPFPNTYNDANFQKKFNHCISQEARP